KQDRLVRNPTADPSSAAACRPWQDRRQPKRTHPPATKAHRQPKLSATSWLTRTLRGRIARWQTAHKSLEAWHVSAGKTDADQIPTKRGRPQAVCERPKAKRISHSPCIASRAPNN